MRTRKLGSTGVELSVIGFGAWALGGGGWAFGWGPQDDAKSIDAIRAALDIGVNWIDTAPVYGLGHSEEVVGKAIKGARDRIFLATKCGLVWSDKGKIKGFIDKQSVRKETEDSLRRLGVDVIDLLQIHWPTKEKKDLEAWETMADLIDEGKIRYAGVSNFNIDRLEKISAIHKPASLQPPYSMLERGVEKELLGYCASNGTGVIAYSPLQCGLLTGGFSRARLENLPDDDFRRKDKQFQEPVFSSNLKLVEGLKAIADEAGMTCAQLALSWVLRREEVTSAITGARSPSQIEETAKAADRELGAEENEAIENLIKARG